MGGWAVAALVCCVASEAAARPPRSTSEADDKQARDGFGFGPIAGATYSSETSLMLGAAAVFFYKHPEELQRRESQVMLAVAYSLRNQFTTFARGTIFVAGDRVRFEIAPKFSIFPNSFFGTGNDTRLEDEERYTPRIHVLDFAAQGLILPNLYVGPACSFQRQVMLERVSDGVLVQDQVVGSAGGTDFGIGLALTYDTRDSTIYPHRGVHATLTSLVSDPLWGSSFRRARTRTDVRGYIPLPPRNHVLALEALTELGSGQAPFWGMARLGGDQLLRGQFEGRYRGRQLLAAQAEYRLPLKGRLGMVGFVGLGEVGTQLRQFRLIDTRYSVGAGLRFRLSNKAPVNLRLDGGWGRDDGDVYFMVGEAF